MYRRAQGDILRGFEMTSSALHTCYSFTIRSSDIGQIYNPLTSSAMERNLDFIYICYDNEGYGNTGQQYSGATPYGAKTATSKGPHGFAGNKKDLFSI